MTLRKRWYRFRLGMKLHGGLIGWLRWRSRERLTVYIILRNSGMAEHFASKEQFSAHVRDTNAWIYEQGVGEYRGRRAAFFREVKPYVPAHMN